MSGEVSGDLVELWEIANNQLPTMANVYGEAATEVYETWCTAENAMFKFHHKSARSRAYEPWCVLRDMTQSIMAETGVNILTAADALNQVIADWSEIDTEAGAKFEEKREELEGGRTEPNPEPPNVGNDGPSVDREDRQRYEKDSGSESDYVPPVMRPGDGEGSIIGA